MNETSRNKMEKMDKPDRKPDEKVLLIAQELELIKMLSGNDQKRKNKALKSLNKWLVNWSTRVQFTEGDFQRIWKGLYYCMWMSDKPLVQEECADKIAKLVHLPDVKVALLFFKAGLYIISQEWSGIQQLRLDKFLMLVRRLLRETLNFLKKDKFNKNNIILFNEVLLDTILNKTNETPMGLFMHFVEIFLEELAKVSNGKLQPSQVLEFVRPFIQCLAVSNDGRKIGHLRKFIFTYLIRQSKLGLEYQEKYNAWRQQGFPGSINSMQKIKIKGNEEEKSDKEIKSDEKKEMNLDPRAGRVDVEIPPLNFKGHEVAKALLDYKFDSKTNAHSRAMIKTLSTQFTSLGNGVYPIGVKTVQIKENMEDMNIRKAAVRLIKFDQKISGKKNKKRKHDKENTEEIVEKKRKKTDNDEVDSSDTKQKLTKVQKEKDIDKAKKLKSKKNQLKPVEEKTNNDINKDKILKKKNKLTTAETQSTYLNDDTEKKQNKKLNSEKNKIEIKENKKNKIKNNYSIDDNKVKSNIIKAKNKLTINCKSKKPKENIECIFERNSGTWVVYEVEKSIKTEKSTKLIKPDGNLRPTQSPIKKEKNDFEVSKVLTKNVSPNQSADNNFLESAGSPNDSPKLGLSPIKLFETLPKEKDLFPKSAWDEPLQEGEYEICIPSKKHITKLKKQAKKKNETVHELINTTLEKIRGKSRLSLDSKLANNPFSKCGSAKKVKINMKLNRSQEVYEHISSVKSSPGIPFDANRKPSKPLLKPAAVSTPINPFYNKQLSL